MKSLFLFLMLFSNAAFAQNSFQIFDSQHNVVTGGILAVSDTAQNIAVMLTVENVDSVTYSVTAGRLVISVPATSSNAITWDLTNYAPTVDTSVVNPVLAPQDSAHFVGDYFSNGNLGTATINYCFWDRADMNNNSCVTVTFNRTPLGVMNTSSNFQFGVFPNPVSVNENLQLNWNAIPGEILSVKLISVDGKINSFSFPANKNLAQISLHDFAAGLYILQIETENGMLYRNKIVVE